MTREAPQNLAFAITEYQQNVLLAIALQKGFRFDLAFVRENIALNPAFTEICTRIIRTTDTPYSWRNAFRFMYEFKHQVRPVTQKGVRYRVFAHSLQSPLVRLFVGNSNNVEVELIEDGTGSYLDWGKRSLRTRVATRLTNLLLALATKKTINETDRVKSGWALHQGCFPGVGVTVNVISPEFFRAAVSKNSQLGGRSNHAAKDVVFVQSPYVEFGILSEQEYIDAHIRALNSLQKYRQFTGVPIMWKLHPRTVVESETERLDRIEQATGIRIEIALFDINIESFALQSMGSVKSYVSLGSSSLYVIKSLLRDGVEVMCIASPLLIKRIPVQAQLMDFFRSIHIQVLADSSSIQ